MANGITELIGPPSIYTSPYTGQPISSPKSATNPYPHQESPPVSWGYKKNNQIIWTESQWNLEGTLTLDPPPFDIHTLDLVNIMGIGKNLSGPWWVNTVTYTIASGSALKVEADVMRNAYGAPTAPAATPAQSNPSRPPKKTVQPKTVSVKIYKIKPGDTLWGIALRFYGNGKYYKQLARYNNIPNPNLIYAGATLKIPSSLG